MPQSRFEARARALRRRLQQSPALRPAVHRASEVVWRAQLRRNADTTTPVMIQLDPTGIDSALWRHDLLAQFGLTEQRELVGLVRGGDWDRAAFPLEELTFFEAVRAHFVDDTDWMETDFYREVDRSVRAGKRMFKYEAPDDLPRQWARIEELHQSMQRDGFRTQAELRTGRPWDEITVAVDRAGKAHFVNGRHRLAVARALGLPTIAAVVGVRHPENAAPPTSAGPTVLCVISYPRSGTTVLANVLGELDGWCHLGELRDFWSRGMLRRSRQLCGCGEPVVDCSVWHAIVKRAFDEQARADVAPTEGASIADTLVPSAAEAMAAAQATLADRRLVLGPDAGPEVRQAGATFALTQAALYRAAAEVYDARVVVDSSKSPAEAAAIARWSGLPVRVLAMNRDPRGVLFSRQRRLAPRRQDGSVVLTPRLTATDALGWLWSDLATSVLMARWQVPIRTLDYDDLMADPQSIIRSLATNVGHLPERWPFDGPRTISLRTNHTVSGNVNRYWTGSVALLPDELWREMLNGRDRAMLAVATAPARLDRRVRRALRARAARPRER